MKSLLPLLVAVTLALSLQSAAVGTRYIASTPPTTVRADLSLTTLDSALINQLVAEIDSLGLLPRTANNIGVLILHDSADPDPARDSVAMRYLRFAADAGVPSACSILADLSLYGLRGLPQDSLAARELYRRAAENGMPEAEYDWLSLLRPEWEDLPADTALTMALDLGGRNLFASAVKLSEIADSQDLPDSLAARAEAIIAYAKANGKGTPYDYRGAIDYFYRAAVKGNPSAAFFLSESLEMFPDLLRDRNAYLTPDLLREIAAQGGVHDAREARQALFAN